MDTTRTYDRKFFAKSVRSAREERFWSQENLAKHSLLSKKTICRVEKGENVSIEARFGVCQALGLDPLKYSYEATRNHSRTSSDLWIEMATNSDPNVRISTARESDIPYEAAEILAFDADLDVVAALYENIHRDAHPHPDLEWGGRPAACDPRFAHLVESMFLRLAPEWRFEQAHQPWGFGFDDIPRHIEIPAAAQEEILGRRGPRVRAWLAARREASRSVLRKISKDPCETVRRIVAQRPDLGGITMELALSHPRHSAVRRDAVETIHKFSEQEKLDALLDLKAIGIRDKRKIDALLRAVDSFEPASWNFPPGHKLHGCVPRGFPFDEDPWWGEGEGHYCW